MPHCLSFRFSLTGRVLAGDVGDVAVEYYMSQVDRFLSMRKMDASGPCHSPEKMPEKVRKTPAFVDGPL